MDGVSVMQSVNLHVAVLTWGESSPVSKLLEELCGQFESKAAFGLWKSRRTVIKKCLNNI